jgi:8-oxo-dGTP diphosphatase
LSSKIEKLIPKRLAVYLWKKLPIPKVLRSKIMWFTNDRFLVAVLGLIQNEQNEVLLLNHTYRSEPWGIPSGWLEYEDPFIGLQREIFEETGFNVKVTNVINIKHTPRPHRIDIYCSGKILEGKFKKSPEISEFGFFNKDNLPEGLPNHQKKLILGFLEGNT